MKINKYIVAILIAIIPIFGYSQYLGLEGDVPSNWTVNSGGEMSMSSAHYKMGLESLRWDWQKGSSIVIDNPEGMQNAVTQYKGGMMMWVYSEKAVDNKINIQFRKGDEVKYHFDFIINFTGWRACWLSFKEDMLGDNKDEDIDNMVINAPTDVASGTLFFDRMKFPKQRINDRVTPDAQLPFINPKMKHNHWGAIYHWYVDYKHDIELHEKMSFEYVGDMNKIEAAIKKMFKGKPLKPKKMKNVKAKFKRLNIVRKNGFITGNAFVHKDVIQKSNKDVKMNKLDKLMINLAYGAVNNSDKECADMYIDLFDYMIDQGFDVASGMGTNHHYGYAFRNMPTSLLLMKDIVRTHGRLEKYSSVMNYWTAIQENRVNPEVGTLQGVVDTWNTMLMARFVSIATMDFSREKVRELESLIRWINISLELAPGTMGGIKPDGSMFHHHGMYPAYSKGGITSLGKILRLLNGTIYQLNDTARRNLGAAIKTMILYSKGYEWGFGVCGRHPLTGDFSQSTVDAALWLAKAGKPFTKEKVWDEMASLYLNFVTKGSNYKFFNEQGISAFDASGSYSFNYAALGIHRDKDWHVSLKAYNDFVWGSEIYVKDNRYGRYQSYGSVQILGSDGAENALESGFLQDGWDWNRYPGTTTIHLPFKKLDSPNKKTLMERSEESFSGSSNLNNKYGIFGFILNERDRVNFTADFEARKSVFCFENRLICLGSDISNSNSHFTTETTLFQTAVGDDSKITVEGKIVEEFPYNNKINSDSFVTLSDNKNNWYFVKDGKVNVRKANQKSKHNKTRKVTHGDFVSAWINHGKVPQGAQYEYLVLVDAKSKHVKAANKSFAGKGKPLYSVLKKSKTAHIVFDSKTKVKGYVLFEANSSLDDDLILSNDTPCFVMIDKSKNISVCNPSVNIKEKGNYAAKPTFVTLVLNGKHKVKDKTGAVTVLDSSNSKTTLKVKCMDGIPVEFKLK